jgi:putative colanic acid biosynthesis UDP-glucose lipid carrier transferase
VTFHAIRNSSSIANTIVQVLDFLAICLGGWLAYQFRFATDTQWATLRPNEDLMVLTLAACATLFFSKVYRMWPGGSLAAMVGRVTLGWLISWVSLIVLLMLTKTNESFSRTWLVSWLLVSVVTLGLGRVLSFLLMARMRRSGYQHKRVLLVGDTQLIETIKNRVHNATWSGYDIVGTLDSANFDALAQSDAALRPDEIWIGLGLADHALLDGLMKALQQSVANIRLVPDLMMYQILNHGMSVTLGIPMVDLSVSPMFGGRVLMKAALDYTVGGVILVLISPLMLTIALMVKLSSTGPVLFRQKRHGWNGEEIWVYKFRSMVVHASSDQHVAQAQRDDPRITRIGKFLRKTSLDELPQFINVMQGRMSVVGPRPHALSHNIAYMKLIPHYALRHKVKPGITGWAQICGYRGETETLDKMEGRIKHDIYYLEHWSLWLDLKIIFLTPIAIIQSKNAY